MLLPLAQLGACVSGEAAPRPLQTVTVDSLGLSLYAQLVRRGAPPADSVLLVVVIGTTRKESLLMWRPANVEIGITDEQGAVLDGDGYSELSSPFTEDTLRRHEARGYVVNLECPAFPIGGPFGRQRRCFGGWRLQRGHRYQVHVRYKAWVDRDRAGDLEFHYVETPSLRFER